MQRTTAWRKPFFNRIKAIRNRFSNTWWKKFHPVCGGKKSSIALQVVHCDCGWNSFCRAFQIQLVCTFLIKNQWNDTTFEMLRNVKGMIFCLNLVHSHIHPVGWQSFAFSPLIIKKRGESLNFFQASMPSMQPKMYVITVCVNQI